MGYRLHTIFITNQKSTSNEEIFSKLGYPHLEKSIQVEFYYVNKQVDYFFMGSRGDCKILVNAHLANLAFMDNEKNPFLQFKDCEIASIIWNSTADVYGFSLIRDGEIIRQIMTVGDEVSDLGIGSPIKEEMNIKEDELFDSGDIQEIIESEGEAILTKMIQSNKVHMATFELSKRYLGVGIDEVEERIMMHQYE